MTYQELIEMDEKYNHILIKTCWTIFAFHIIIAAIILAIIGPFSLFLAANLIFVITIVVIALTMSIIFCALKINLYLRYKMKKAQKKKTKHTISRMKQCCLNLN